MKSEKNIFIAFLLNFVFSIFEFFGGIFTGSVAIISDSVHDIGDAISIGLSYFLEKKAKKQPDDKYSYGYARYSVLGSAITTFVLLFGSVVVIYNAVLRLISPVKIHYDGMIIFAVVGVCVNFLATFFTREKVTLNQKAVNLHMLEDVLGWIVVLVGAVVMRFTDFYIIDPILSISVAVFIFINAIKNLKEIIDLFLEKTPKNVNIKEIKEKILQIVGIIDVHHVHVWSLDGQNCYATMHIVSDGDCHEIKDNVRQELKKYGICHVTLELEKTNEHCHEKNCEIQTSSSTHHHHHHHH